MHGFRNAARVMRCCLLVAGSIFALAPAALAAERIPNDPLFSEQWYLRKIGAAEAWSSSLGFEGVTIAVIDTGTDLQHPDLKENIWINADEIPGNGLDDDVNGFIDDVRGWDFFDNDNDPNPPLDSTGGSANIHGTVSAGIAAAQGNNGQGIAGVTWQTRIMPLRALGPDGTGETFPIVRAIDYAVANGARVINLSFAGPADASLLAIAARHAYDSGVVVVAAAGNAIGSSPATDLDRQQLYPVCLDSGKDANFVIGVAATDENDQRAVFSNYGSCVDVAAPGTRFVSTRLFRSDVAALREAYGGYFNGTSLSAPLVSGTIALMLGVNPRLNPGQITAILQNTAVSLDSLNPDFRGKLGRGRIDAAAAVAAAMPQSTAPAPGAPLPPVTAPAARAAVVTAPGAGRPPDVRLFTADGIFVRSFPAFAESFRGGVSLATGRFAKDGLTRIVVGAGPGGGPQIRVFDQDGRVIGSFFAYDERFRGGVNVGAGDTDGDGKDEIVSGAGPGGGPHVRIFASNGGPIGGFFAYDPSLRGGVNVGAGDTDGDGKDEIMTWLTTGSAEGRLFSASGVQLGTFSLLDSKTKERRQPVFFDADADGKDDIVLLPPKAGGRALVLSRDGSRRGDWDPETGRFFSASGAPSTPGGRGAVGSPKGRPPVVRAFLPFALGFVAYEPKFLGGASAALLR